MPCLPGLQFMQTAWGQKQDVRGAQAGKEGCGSDYGRQA